MTHILCPPKPHVQPLEDDLCYANLSLQQPRTSPLKKGSSMSSSGKDHQEEVEYVTMVRLVGPWRCEPAAASLPWKVNPTPMWTQLMGVGSERSEDLAAQTAPSGSQSYGKCFSWGRAGGSVVVWLKVIWGSYQHGRPDSENSLVSSGRVATLAPLTL